MRGMIALPSLALALLPPAARAVDSVDMLLVLAADVSRSVTESKFRLQREGAAAAITNPDVVKAITSGPNRRILRCFPLTVGGSHPRCKATDVTWRKLTRVPGRPRYGGEQTT